MNSRMLAQTMNSPNTIETGKPSEKTFNCGAARVITPKARFTTSSAITVGNASSKPLRNSHDAADTSLQLGSGPKAPDPAGR